MKRSFFLGNLSQNVTTKTKTIESGDFNSFVFRRRVLKELSFVVSTVRINLKKNLFLVFFFRNLIVGRP